MEWERFHSLHPNHPRVPTAGMRYRLTNVDARAELDRTSTRNITVREMPEEIVAHWLTQGVMRGLFYGMLYGACIGILSDIYLLLVEAFAGAITGAIVGCVAGFLTGLLNAAALAFTYRWHRNRPEP
ncbi:MAG: hypothetical protein JWQ02_956, partial [Capsulimonas sp.]|nr:hypothetical protein [Capsulimonas sp.]